MFLAAIPWVISAVIKARGGSMLILKFLRDNNNFFTIIFLVWDEMYNNLNITM